MHIVERKQSILAIGTIGYEYWKLIVPMNHASYHTWQFLRACLALITPTTVLPLSLSVSCYVDLCLWYNVNVPFSDIQFANRLTINTSSHILLSSIVFNRNIHFIPLNCYIWRFKNNFLLSSKILSLKLFCCHIIMLKNVKLNLKFKNRIFIINLNDQNCAKIAYWNIFVYFLK